MKRMTDEEFEARCNAAHADKSTHEVTRWRTMAGVAISEAERARAREARLEEALREIRDADYCLRRMDMMALAEKALGAE